MVKATDDDTQEKDVNSQIVQATQILQGVASQLTVELQVNQMKAVLGTLGKLIRKRQPTSVVTAPKKEKVKQNKAASEENRIVKVDSVQTRALKTAYFIFMKIIETQGGDSVGFNRLQPIQGTLAKLVKKYCNIEESDQYKGKETTALNLAQRGLECLNLVSVTPPFANEKHQTMFTQALGSAKGYVKQLLKHALSQVPKTIPAPT